MNIAIFASGAGSNAEVIIHTLPQLIDEINVRIALVVTNNTDARVVAMAQNNNLPTEIINLKNKTAEEISESYLDLLKKYAIDFIVLAGYLKKIPTAVISAFPQKIMNIHPALLPAYGGAGMFGKHVHEAVIAAGEKQSGITIHFVDEVYDHGKIIFQATCNVEEGETSTSLAKKVQALEYKYYSKIIADTLVSQIPVK
jgi:formyltetrahydrofolate-dependent phosphoribosylglycinamide formyltransferase